MKHNKKHIDNLKLQNRIFWVLLVSACVGIFLYVTREKIISPLSDNPVIPQVYAAQPDGLREHVLLQVIRRWGTNQVYAFDRLVFKESSWNPRATNPTSGAYGLYQALPFSKTGCLREDIDCQTAWAFEYIKQRYGNPVGAYKFHLSHGWY